MEGKAGSKGLERMSMVEFVEREKGIEIVTSRGIFQDEMCIFNVVSSGRGDKLI